MTSLLYIYTVYAAIQLLYREGVQGKPAPPLIGQVVSDRHRGVPLLYVWPLDWTANASYQGEPLAVLWNPTLCGIGYDNIVFRGLEAVPKGVTRRWVAQKWLCDVLDAARARARLGPDLRYGEVRPAPGL